MGVAVNTAVRRLFHQLADAPDHERSRILAGGEIAPELRAEVASLLGYDSVSGGSLARSVSTVAAKALQAPGRPASNKCGPYELVRLLGAGGMGAVYLAERRDGEIQQRVAIKLLRSDADRPTWRERFLRERQLLAYLNHPFIAHLLDAGHTHDGRPYLVMEYVDGVAIDTYAESLDLRAKLALFLLVCDGVSHAHCCSIVHRDLKPSNILVDSSGRPKLLDFGIGKLLDIAADETQTVERMFTPSYASPEQLRGEAQTVSTDVYSLGAVLYKLLTGHSPREFRTTATARIAPAVAGASETTASAKLPGDLEHILNKAMHHDPAERYASADLLAG